MKIKLLNGILIIDILTVLLILTIIFIPSSVMRIILGLPFLLFFPGYMLVAALFPRNLPLFKSSAAGESSLRNGEEMEDKGKATPLPKLLPSRGRGGSEEGRRVKGGMDGIERLALSFGMSIAVVALIGLGLNYTAWGIRLEPVLYSMATFIIVMSAIALLRRRRFEKTEITQEYFFKVPDWEGNALNKTLTIILSISIVGAIGVLGYAVAFPKVGEIFTEFYILGLNGKAQNYPAEFAMKNNQVTGVKYGDATQPTASALGRVVLGIVNHERQNASYSIIVKIDGEQVNINYAGKNISQLQIELQQGEKWEQEIAFAPNHIGDNQKVEFLLYMDNASAEENALHLWVNVKAK